MKSLAILLTTLSIVGCTSSVQVTDTPTTFTTPATSGYGSTYGPEVPIVKNPDCDSAKVAAEILERALKDVQAQIEGYLVGVDLTLEQTRSKDLVIDGLKRTVETLRAKVSVLVKEPPKQVDVPKEWLDKYKALQVENAKLRGNQESHTFFWFVGAGLAVFLAGAIFAILAAIVGRLRGLISL